MGKKLILSVLILALGSQSFAEQAAFANSNRAYLNPTLVLESTENKNSPDSEPRLLSFAEVANGTVNDIAHVVKNTPSTYSIAVFTDDSDVVKAVGQASDEKYSFQKIVVLPFGKLLDTVQDKYKNQTNKIAFWIATITIATETIVCIHAQKTINQGVALALMNFWMYAKFTLDNKKLSQVYGSAEESVINTLARFNVLNGQKYQQKQSRMTTFASMLLINLAIAFPKMIIANVHDAARVFSVGLLATTSLSILLSTFASLRWSRVDQQVDNDAHPVARFSLNTISNTRGLGFSFLSMVQNLNPEFSASFAIVGNLTNGLAGYYAHLRSSKFINWLSQNSLLAKAYQKKETIVSELRSPSSQNEIPSAMICSVLFKK